MSAWCDIYFAQSAHMIYVHSMDVENVRNNGFGEKNDHFILIFSQSAFYLTYIALIVTNAISLKPATLSYIELFVQCWSIELH